MPRATTAVPVVAGLAYRERLRALPGEFTATLHPEPENPYNPRAIAVHGPTGKIGYVAPEVARHCYERVAASPVTCRVRRGSFSQTTGLEAVVDLSGLLE